MTSRPRRVCLELPAETLAALTALAQSNRVTLNEAAVQAIDHGLVAQDRPHYWSASTPRYDWTMQFSTPRLTVNEAAK